MSPMPGHELYKQLVELAFHVKKSDTNVELESLFERDI